MGNNHDKFFSKNKRKILILGIQNSGKSTFLQTLKMKTPQVQTALKNDLDIQDVKLKNLTLCFFDLGGADRQRIFWRQNFFGTQGIIYVIDVKDDKIDLSLNELEKIVLDPDLQSMPIAVYMNNFDHNSDQSATNLVQINKALVTMNLKVETENLETKTLRQFEGSCQNCINNKKITNKDNQVLDCINWLLKEMKPI